MCWKMFALLSSLHQGQSTRMPELFLVMESFGEDFHRRGNLNSCSPHFKIRLSGSALYAERAFDLICPSEKVSRLYSHFR